MTAAIISRWRQANCVFKSRNGNWSPHIAEADFGLSDVLSRSFELCAGA